QAHDESARTLGYSPCGRYLVSGGSDGKTRIWDTFRTRMIHEHSSSSSVSCVRYSPDGKMWATISRDGDIKVFSTADNSQVFNTKFAPNAGF
ncbi:hypothetical protein ABTM69_20050, partial [Acinetobacter baumannii]